MTSLALVALGAALAALAFHWRELALPRLRRPDGVRVADVMSSEVAAISAQLTVEEVVHGRLGPRERDVYAVVDRDGHALGVLLRDDLVRVPHTERPARLVGELLRPAVVPRSADLVETLERLGGAATGTAVVVDAARMPVGLLRPSP